MVFGGNKSYLAIFAVVISGLITSGFAVNAATAVTSGIDVCVKAKTQEMVLAKSGKCKPGFRKVIFGSPAGASSPTPTPTVTITATPAPTTIVSSLSVYDSAGNQLGPVTSAASFGEWSFMVEGYIVTAYPESGVIRDNGVGGYYSTSACAGTVYWPLETWDRANRFKNSDPLVVNYTPPGTSRRTGVVQLMVQNLSGTPLPASTPEMWVLDYNGQCTRTIEFSPDSGISSQSLLWMPMREVARVRDFSGPLSIR